MVVKIKKKKQSAYILIAVIFVIAIAFTVSAGGVIKILAGISSFHEIESNGTNTGGIVGNDASASGGQFLQFTDSGDNWQFTTNMTSMGIWVTRSTFGTVFEVYINGTYYGTFNTYDQAGTTYKRELRLFNYLNGNNHTIVINHTGAINPSGQKVLDLDAFITNATAVIDLREAEDDWSNRSGIYLTENGNASSDAILQLPNASSYFETWGSGKYILIYTKDSLLSTFYNVTYANQNFSFNTYFNGYLHRQKRVVLINSTLSNSLLRISNSGLNNTINNSIIDLDYIIFYPFDRPTNSTINISAQLNETHLNISWSNSSAESGRIITYHVVATAFENSTSVRVANTTDLNLTAVTSSLPQDYYTFKIEANDDYLESFSGDTTELMFFDSKKVNQRAKDATNYIITSQKGDGAIPDSFNSEFYNSDNTAGYAGIALYQAWRNTSNVSYIDSLGSYLDWFAVQQESDGTWHYAYKYNATNSSYYADVWDYYKNLNITDIKVVDAIQSYFAYDLWMYSISGRNSTKVVNLTPVAELGMKRLIADNYDGNRFFYSSTQYKNNTNNWVLLETKYAAGQIDVFLGMLALWNLTQNITYLEYAKNIKNNFDSYYWNSSSARYSIALDALNAQEGPTEYLFVQGYAPSIFGKSQNNSLNAYNYLKTKEYKDGSINTSNSTSLKQTTNASTGETLISAMTILASRKLDQGKTENLTNYLRKMQVDTTTNASGGMKFDKNTSSLSVTTVAFGSSALFSDDLPLPDLLFKNAVNISPNFRRYQNFTANITIEYVSLSHYIFSTNASGSWNNKTVNISGVQYNASEQSNITITSQSKVCWYYWANDTSGSSWQSSTYCFNVQNTPPVFNETISDKSATVDQTINFRVNCSDVDDDIITYYDNASLFDINSSGGVSDTPLSTEIGSYYINITCGDGTNNISQAFVYTINAASSSSPPSSGGGGGGSSRPRPTRECREKRDCPKDYYCVDNKCLKIFDLKTLQVDSPVEPGEFLDFTYLIKGMADISGDVVLDFWLESESSREKQKMATGSDVIFIGNFEEKIESTSLFLPSDIPEGRYVLFIKLSYDGYEAVSSRIIEIKPEVVLKPNLAITSPLEVLPYALWNYSFILSVNKDYLEGVVLKQRILKEGGREREQIIWSKTEELVVNRSILVSNTITGLEPGDYLLELTAEAGKQTFTIVESFNIEAPKNGPSIQQILNRFFLENYKLSNTLLIFGMIFAAVTLLVTTTILAVYFFAPKRIAYDINELKLWVSKEKQMGSSDSEIRKILQQNTGWTRREVDWFLKFKPY